MTTTFVKKNPSTQLIPPKFSDLFFLVYGYSFFQIFHALHLFKALRLFFLPNLPGPTLIPCPTSITDSRVDNFLFHSFQGGTKGKMLENCQNYTLVFQHFSFGPPWKL